MQGTDSTWQTNYNTCQCAYKQYAPYHDPQATNFLSFENAYEVHYVHIVRHNVFDRIQSKLDPYCQAVLGLHEKMCKEMRFRRPRTTVRSDRCFGVEAHGRTDE